MSDLRLIILLVISSFIGVLGGTCTMAFPLLLFMFGAGDAGVIDSGLRVMFGFLFVGWFASAGILTVIMMRIFIGSQIISLKDGSTRFAVGSVIGAAVTSPFLSLEKFGEAAALGFLLTFAVGGTSCWLRMRENEKTMGNETLTALNLSDRK